MSSRRGRPNRKQGNVLQFDPESLKYDPEDFYVPATDHRGHSARLNVRIPPELESELEKFLAASGKKFGYESISAIIRHGVVRHMEYLHRLEPGVTRTYLGALLALVEVNKADYHKQFTEELFADLFKRVDHHIQMGDQNEITRLCYEVKRTINMMDECPAKHRLMTRFKRTYGHYLYSKPAVTVDALPCAPELPAPAPVPEAPPDNVRPISIPLFCEDPEGDDEE